MRILRIMRKTRLWRYERRSSFLVSWREIPSSGDTIVLDWGRDEVAESREFVSVDNRAGRVAAAAILSIKRKVW